MSKKEQKGSTDIKDQEDSKKNDEKDSKKEKGKLPEFNFRMKDGKGSSFKSNFFHKGKEMTIDCKDGIVTTTDQELAEFLSELGGYTPIV